MLTSLNPGETTPSEQGLDSSRISLHLRCMGPRKGTAPHNKGKGTAAQQAAAEAPATEARPEVTFSALQQLEEKRKRLCSQLKDVERQVSNKPGPASLMHAVAGCMYTFLLLHENSLQTEEARRFYMQRIPVGACCAPHETASSAGTLSGRLSAAVVACVNVCAGCLCRYLTWRRGTWRAAIQMQMH